jgi:hypothetical protein
MSGPRVQLYEVPWLVDVLPAPYLRYALGDKASEVRKTNSGGMHEVHYSDILAIQAYISYMEAHVLKGRSPRTLRTSIPF